MKTLKIEGVAQTMIDLDIGTGSVQMYLPKTEDGAARLVDWVAGKISLSGYVLEEYHLESVGVRPVTLGAELGPKAIVYGPMIDQSKVEAGDE